MSKSEPSSPSPSPLRPISQFKEKAAQAGVRLDLPDFETTPAALRASMETAIQEANQRLDRIASLTPDSIGFDTTIRELDDCLYPPNLAANRIYLIKETHPESAMREQATEFIKEFQEWAVGLDYREDVYQSIKAFAQTRPQLSGEDHRLYEDTLRDYRRAGLDLPASERNEIERLRKQLSQVSTDFDANITQASGHI